MERKNCNQRKRGINLGNKKNGSKRKKGRLEEEDEDKRKKRGHVTRKYKMEDKEEAEREKYVEASVNKFISSVFLASFFSTLFSRLH